MITKGEHTYTDGEVSIFFLDAADLKIGKYCSIASDCTIFLGGNHRVDWISTYPFSRDFNCTLVGHPSTKGDIVIGNDVWIGQGVTILPGVIVGDGAVIGAKSVVVKDVPPYSVVCGNPAELKKFRFTIEEIKMLLELKWWDWSDEKVYQAIPFLTSGDLESLINFGERKCSA